MLWQQCLPIPRRQQHLSHESIGSFDWKMRINKILVMKEKAPDKSKWTEVEMKGN